MKKAVPPRLPHRAPFLLLDAILEMTPGAHARAEKLVNGSDTLVRDDTSLSEVLLIEAMAQCIGVAAVTDQGDATDGVLVAIDRFRVHGVVVAGDRLAIEARIVKKMGAMTKARATIHVAGELRAEGELVLRLGPLPRAPV